MPLTLPCPHCHATLRLAEPFPTPGTRLSCPACGTEVRVAYPEGVATELAGRGRRFADPGEPPGPVQVDRARSVPAAPPPPPPAGLDFGAPRAAPRRPTPADEAPTEVLRSPTAGAPDARASQPPPPPAAATQGAKTVAPATAPSRAAPPPSAASEARATPTPPAPRAPTARPTAVTAEAAPPRRPSRWVRAARWAAVLAVVGVVGAAVGFKVLEATYASDLPSIEALRAYRPATVTTVHATDGTLLGELYEERRYVLPLDDIPKQVQDAFVAAEDASFWEHGGIDYMGIVRAMGRNLRAGRVSQGGSTITQQVAKNFLLTSDRKFARKVKEAFLAWRIEAAYDKEHILYLYLNEIFLGSQAYGVEAASRTFFGKHVDELTLGEAAMIAGLPPRPSSWNPHADFAAAKVRQGYVLDQLVAKGRVTAAEADAARAETIVIVPRGNTFREAAPHFTEYARRYLIDHYGEEMVLKQGLSVRTTCDLGLQTVAQRAVTDGVRDIDERMGWRRADIEHVEGDAAIQARIDAIEAELQQAWLRRTDVTGRTPLPPVSVVQAGDVVSGVVTQVTPHAIEIAVGKHTGVVPLAWADWLYPPDPERSWRYRTQDDLTRLYDLDGDGDKDDPLVARGDVVHVRIVALSPGDEAVGKAFDKLGDVVTDDTLALRLTQVPEVEAALLSFDLSDDPARAGAVRAMVGGADFDRSQLNRVVQSRRQVGSTFKPIVYTAALETRKLTTASIVPDAPLAFGSGEEIWKPGNYGDDYKGNITLRQALALSRNTSTVRVLDAVDPGMSRGVVYDFARRLGLGGVPKHLQPEGWVSTPEADHLCPWVPNVAGNGCVDPYTPPDGGTQVCRACDLSMGLGSASLTMEELARAYGILANGGRYVEPWYIEQVTDRDGNVLQTHTPAEPVEVVDPSLATLATWLMEAVATSGTAAQAHRDLKVHVAGKTGTTNDEKDAWFVGFTNDVVTAVWVGYDQPRTLGVSSTGGRTALPIWIDYMSHAIEGHEDRAFPTWGQVDWASIDEDTGRRVTSGGRDYPFLKGTVPEATGYAAGQASLQDLATEL
ncbi:MAG: transglycosylase domain-containing protein [Alphaproteobacteria bacterium]|nr:transglycosylase domain-containing protein [Alphaproteobacteria bacterium]